MPQNISEGRISAHSALQARFSTTRLVKSVSPIIHPPAADASVPPSEIAPFVPGGTGFSVVMRIGGDRESMPSSEASVSPRQQANLL